ncbi:MAG: hypothetical protein CVU06_08340 [Bacteroidetes bacterium HGW-Bacteroidetes-22]|nr:MAG: hypothetical protein CVU06_08340 [Bacteroidetes bacterium HGW-Bacteroidetes-22]
MDQTYYRFEVASKRLRVGFVFPRTGNEAVGKQLRMKHNYGITHGSKRVFSNIQGELIREMCKEMMSY